MFIIQQKPVVHWQAPKARLIIRKCLAKTIFLFRFKYGSIKGNFHIIFLMYCHNQEGFLCRRLPAEDNKNRENWISDLSWFYCIVAALQRQLTNQTQFSYKLYTDVCKKTGIIIKLLLKVRIPAADCYKIVLNVLNFK